jgi:NhaP-type Na+/H+ or K+/H+ antiporter
MHRSRLTKLALYCRPIIKRKKVPKGMVRTVLGLELLEEAFKAQTSPSWKRWRLIVVLKIPYTEIQTAHTGIAVISILCTDSEPQWHSHY